MLTRTHKLIEQINQYTVKLKHTLWFYNHPKVFCNSFHKSGTQLLVQALTGIQGIHHYNRSAFHHILTKNQINPAHNSTFEEVNDQLAGLLPGEMMGGHVEYHAAIEQAIQAYNVRHVLIIRDPRDVIISHLFWWEEHQEIDIWPFRFFKSLKTRDEKLMFLILGHNYESIKSDKNYPYLNFPNIIERFETYKNWLSSPHCLVVHFEDMKANPYDEFKRIFSWIWPQKFFSEAIYKKMAAASHQKFSKTYRISKTGQWHAYFNEEHVEAFYHLGGQRLLRNFLM